MTAALTETLHSVGSDSLSTSWGTFPRPAGKCVWSEMPVVSTSTAHLDCTDRDDVRDPALPAGPSG